MYEKKTIMFPGSAVSAENLESDENVFRVDVRLDVLGLCGCIRTE